MRLRTAPGSSEGWRCMERSIPPSRPSRDGPTSARSPSPTCSGFRAASSSRWWSSARGWHSSPQRSWSRRSRAAGLAISPPRSPTRIRGEARKRNGEPRLPVLHWLGASACSAAALLGLGFLLRLFLLRVSGLLVVRERSARRQGEGGGNQGGEQFVHWRGSLIGSDG